MRTFGVKEYRERLTGFQKKISPTLLQKLLTNGTSILADNMRKRIFFDGKDRVDNLISTKYSKKTIYVSKEDFVKKSAFKPKKGRKTMKLEGGYSELRKIQGMETRKVNLRYSGKLMADLKATATFTSIDIGSKTNSVNAKIKIGFKTKLSGYKAEKLEKQYGLENKIFRPSKQEVRDYINYIQS